ncbi:MAG TPA: alpha-amylase family glycosyl hydrolase [Bryobacteraceae bacterium]|nr:alpha-amylase family glycosyl hydrolase [Bryobacteraceae bacterium]
MRHPGNRRSRSSRFRFGRCRPGHGRETAATGAPAGVATQGYRTGPGEPHPPGASFTGDGFNFSFLSEDAHEVELLLFEPAPQARQAIRLDAACHRSFHFWHVRVFGLAPGAHYLWRIDGEVRCDPWALACVVRDGVRRAVAVDPAEYDWSGDAPPDISWEDSVLYEMHVRGFTQSAAAGVAHPGTFAGVVERIPYLKELGITAVQLLPVMDFDSSTPVREVLGRPLTNYWGYGTLGYLAPHPAYLMEPDAAWPLGEFCDMVKALHGAGMEVLLDAGGWGGCVSVMEHKLVIEALRYWTREAHVDGFVLGPVPEALLWELELDEELAGAKLITGVQAPQSGWPEWNHAFRNTIRRFVRGEAGLVHAVARALTGSAGLVNYVTSHNGLTLRDLVSYEWNHNEFNGAGSCDGEADNLSWNCGEEGETTDPDIQSLRARQVRNFAALLMLSRGIPLVLAGDETGRTQRGNNNAWCQDNETSWADWSPAAVDCGLLRFWQRLIAFRKNHAALRRGAARIAWHGTRLNAPGWNDPHARALAFTLAGVEGQADLHVMVNMYWEPLEFEVPAWGGRDWLVSIDTSEPSPRDIASPGAEPAFRGASYPVEGRSIVVLTSQ